MKERIRLGLIGAAALVLLSYQTPASPHCYSIWKYPQPQRCGAPSHNWYVEVVEQPTPPEKDLRSDQDKAAQAEHDAAMKTHHEDLKLRLELLRSKEATGIE